MKILPDGTFAIKAHPTKGEQCRCDICVRKSVHYDNGRDGICSWWACDWNTHKVYIVADIHRVMCPRHGVVTAFIPLARHKSRFTKEFEELATWLSLSCTKTAVASLLRISRNTIGPIISRMRAELDANPAVRFVGLVRIGVDETSYKKGHKYITVVINHYDAILATMEHHLSNAVLEATNRKIKLSVYMAYGFRNIDNMIDMIMLRCSDIDVRLPWDYEAV